MRTTILAGKVCRTYAVLLVIVAFPQKGSDLTSFSYRSEKKKFWKRWSEPDLLSEKVAEFVLQNNFTGSCDRNFEILTQYPPRANRVFCGRELTYALVTNWAWFASLLNLIRAAVRRVNAMRVLAAIYQSGSPGNVTDHTRGIRENIRMQKLVPGVSSTTEATNASQKWMA